MKAKISIYTNRQVVKIAWKHSQPTDLVSSHHGEVRGKRYSQGIKRNKYIHRGAGDSLLRIPKAASGCVGGMGDALCRAPVGVGLRCGRKEERKGQGTRSVCVHQSSRMSNRRGWSLQGKALS